MDVAKYSRLIKQSVSQESIEGWSRSQDQEDFCISILRIENEHPVIQKIVAGALNNILSYNANKLAA